MEKQMDKWEVAQMSARKILTMPLGGILGLTLGHLASYGLSLGAIGGAVPADFKIYVAFIGAMLGLLY